MLIKVVLIVIAIISAIFGFIKLNKISKENSRQFYYGAIEKIKGFMLDLVFDAEKLYQSGTGRFKKAYVINLILNGEFYKGLPTIIQKMITYSILSDLVDNIVGSVFNVIKDSVNVKERLEG